MCLRSFVYNLYFSTFRGTCRAPLEAANCGMNLAAFTSTFVGSLSGFPSSISWQQKHATRRTNHQNTPKQSWSSDIAIHHQTKTVALVWLEKGALSTFYCWPKNANCQGELEWVQVQIKQRFTKRFASWNDVTEQSRPVPSRGVETFSLLFFCTSSCRHWKNCNDLFWIIPPVKISHVNNIVQFSIAYETTLLRYLSDVSHTKKNPSRSFRQAWYTCLLFKRCDSALAIRLHGSQNPKMVWTYFIPKRFGSNWCWIWMIPKIVGFPPKSIPF